MFTQGCIKFFFFALLVYVAGRGVSKLVLFLILLPFLSCVFAVGSTIGTGDLSRLYLSQGEEGE